MKFLLPIISLISLGVISLQSSAHSFKTSHAVDVFFEHNKFQKMDGSSFAKLQNFTHQTTTSTLKAIIIIGRSGVGEKNQLPLSFARAEVVKRQLVELGIPNAIIFTEGKGASQPAGSDLNLNARVEVESVGILRGWDSRTWKDIQSQALSWQTLDLTIRPKASYTQDEVPRHWRSAQRNKLPIYEFIQSIEDPVWREVFAHKLLLEAIRRKDDALAKQAHEERLIAQIILEKTSKHSRLNIYPHAALEAASYGTEYAKNLTRLELQQIEAFDDVKQAQLQTLACKEPIYEKRNDANFIQGAQSLFGMPKFFEHLSTKTQSAILKCLQHSDRYYAMAFNWSLMQGANPDLTNEKGQSFLHVEIIEHGARHVEALIKAHANPNAIDAQGNTPLHNVNLARREGYGGTLSPTIHLNKQQKQKLWDTLIAAGANPNIPNKAG